MQIIANIPMPIISLIINPDLFFGLRGVSASFDIEPLLSCALLTLKYDFSDMLLPIAKFVF